MRYRRSKERRERGQKLSYNKLLLASISMAVSGLRAFSNHFVSIESYYMPVMSFFSTYI
jgi:hypothetical protein